jgi:repressor LexA
MNENQTPTLPSDKQPLRPTKKQKELLAYIERFIVENGYSPSYREIMNGLQYTSVATVALHVNNLIKRGHLLKRGHSARSLEVVAPVGIVDAKLPTNEVKESEEKWLIAKVEKLFLDAEAEALPTPMQLEDIGILLAAMRVLGLEGAAQSFATRLAALRAALEKK